MKKLRQSIHSSEHELLRQIFIQQRKALGLSQRDLANCMGIIYSAIGKIETGDRRLDVIEFIQYCQVLEISPHDVMDKILQSSSL